MNKENKAYVPPIVSHPGVILKEKLDELNMSIKEFALRSGKPEKTVHAILRNESSITPDMAVQFERVLQIPAHFWLKAQRNYDEAQARERRSKEIEEAIDWMRNFPIPDMVKKGFIPSVKSLKEKAEALLSFFGIAKSDAWNDYFQNQTLATVFRMSLKKQPDQYALSAWLRYGEIQARSRTVSPFSQDSVKAKIGEFLNLANSNSEDFKTVLAELCAKIGIILVYTPHLVNTKASGATRWFCDRPLIQVSDCHKRYDIFWFSFFHELGHVILHNKKDIFLEGIKYSDQDMSKEQEADHFAGKNLLPQNLELKLYEMPYSEITVSNFSKEYGIHPAFIVGRMHFLEKWAPYQGQQFIPSIDFSK